MAATHWAISFSDDARLQRMRLTQSAKSEVNRVRRALRTGPNIEPGAIELHGHPGIWRIRLKVGNRRLIYRVDEKQRRIIVLDILRRDEAYTKYPLPDDD